jgi:hypothetical protein
MRLQGRERLVAGMVDCSCPIPHFAHGTRDERVDFGHELRAVLARRNEHAWPRRGTRGFEWRRWAITQRGRVGAWTGACMYGERVLVWRGLHTDCSCPIPHFAHGKRDERVDFGHELRAVLARRNEHAWPWRGSRGFEWRRLRGGGGGGGSCLLPLLAWAVDLHPLQARAAHRLFVPDPPFRPREKRRKGRFWTRITRCLGTP